MEISYNDHMAGIGASYHWKSNNSGNGDLIIDEAQYPTNIRSKMSFEDWKGVSFSYWDLGVNDEKKTKLTWRLETDTPISFFVRGIMLLNGSQKKLENGMQEGINLLKTTVEEKYASNTLIVQKTDLMDRTFAIQRDRVKFENITDFYKEHLGFLATSAMTKNVAMNGMPCGLFYSWDSATRTTDMAAAIPVNEVFDINPGAFVSIEAGNVLYVDHYGPYKNLELAHNALTGYIQENGLNFKEPIIEEYMNDPTLVSDSSKIHTRVYYYLK
jgi:effector-binding domain-containing protein